MKLDVVLPAGGRIDGEFAAEAGVGVKALIARCTDPLGCSAKGVRDSSPELAFDLDYIREYRYAVKALGNCR